MYYNEKQLSFHCGAIQSIFMLEETFQSIWGEMTSPSVQVDWKLRADTVALCGRS